MQIETIGKCQLHLIAHEVAKGGWEPYVTIFRFDDETRDFKCLLPKQRASEEPMPDYEQAIDAARRAGHAFLKKAAA